MQLAETACSLAPTFPPAPDVSEPPWVDALGVFAHRAELERAQDADARALAEVGASIGAASDVEAAAAFLEAGVAPEKWPEPIDTPATRARHATLVRTEERLVAAAATVGPGPRKSDTPGWVELLVSGLSFAINIAESKLDALARHGAALIVKGNVLGGALVIRSMVEHHALAIELGLKGAAVWDRAEKLAPNPQRVGDELKAAEKQLARALAGSSAANEDARAWRTVWGELVKTPHNVMTPIKALEKSMPGVLQAYGLLSHVVHGTVCTGGDLLPTDTGESRAANSTLAQAVLLLASLLKPTSVLDRQANSILLAHRLDRTGRGEQGVGAGIKSAALLAGQKLKPRRDVLGTGTESDPFRFRRGLVYHDAYLHYLKQEGVAVQSRTTCMFDSGPGDRVETEDGRVIYFLNDTMGV